MPMGHAQQGQSLVLKPDISLKKNKECKLQTCIPRTLISGWPRYLKRNFYSLKARDLRARSFTWA